jgi:N-glycosylase/DNA lyase
MEKLIEKIEELKNCQIKNSVETRINDFKNIDKNSNNDLFQEMCFCLLTANFNAEKSIKIQNNIGEQFIFDTREELSKRLKSCGHRFPNARASYIKESMKYKDKLAEIIKHRDKNAIREWMVKNVKGLGYKESSHFLRNVGFDDFAIIDFHIIDILARHKLIKKPKTITRKRYFEIENVLRRIAEKTNLTLAELDLYLWYIETGKILK